MRIELCISKFADDFKVDGSVDLLKVERLLRDIRKHDLMCHCDVVLHEVFSQLHDSMILQRMQYIQHDLSCLLTHLGCIRYVSHTTMQITAFFH